MHRSNFLLLSPLLLLFATFSTPVKSAADPPDIPTPLHAEDRFLVRSAQAEYSRLYDTLSALVKEEYRGIRVEAADDGETAHEVAAHAEPAISSINEQSMHSGVLFEGDIRIPLPSLRRMIEDRLDEVAEDEEEEEEIASERDGVEGSGEEDVLTGRRKRTRRKVLRRADGKWTGGVIPFEFHPFISLSARDAIQRAINFWQRETCVVFRPRFFDPTYLYFVAHDGCWSTVGKDDLQGQQWLSIGAGCEAFGVVVHELGHALGLFHEQSRFDRDKYISLDFSKVQNGMVYQFSKISAREMMTYGLPYDVGSVMHYNPIEFSKSAKRPALRARDPYLQYTMGQLGEPSFIDVRMINEHYGCSRRCRRRISCLHQGYQDPHNCGRCKCPSGFGGVRCERVGASTIPRCGGTVRATTGLRQLHVHIRWSLFAADERRCVYHIVAPADTAYVEVRLVKVAATCLYGCWKEGVEMKASKDPRVTGYRFCCPSHKGSRIIARKRRVPIMIYARRGDSNIIMHYRYEKRQKRQNETESTGWPEGDAANDDDYEVGEDDKAVPFFAAPPQARISTLDFEASDDAL